MDIKPSSKTRKIQEPGEEKLREAGIPGNGMPAFLQCVKQSRGALAGIRKFAVSWRYAVCVVKGFSCWMEYQIYGVEDRK